MLDSLNSIFKACNERLPNGDILLISKKNN